MKSYKLLDREIYERLRSYENGQMPAPYYLSLFLPMRCPFRCRFCAMNMLKNIEKSGYSDELNFVITIYASKFGLSDGEIKKIHRFVDLELDDLKEKAAGLLGQEALGDIMENYRSSNMTTVFNLPYRVIRILTESGITVSDAIVMSAALTVKLMASLLGQKYSEALPVETYLSLIDQAADMGIKRILIGGLAEAFIQPEYTIPIIRKVRSRGLYGIVVTSGSIINDEILKALVENEWGDLTVSLDASDERGRAELRGKEASFTAVLELLDRIKRLKKEAGTDRPSIGFNNVITNKNYMQIPDILKIGEEHGVDYMNFVPVWMFSAGASELALTDDEIARMKKMLKANNGWKDSPVENNITELLEMDVMKVDTIISNPPEYDRAFLDSGRYTVSDTKDTEITGGVKRIFDNVPCLSPWLELTIEASGSPKLCCHEFVCYSNLNIKKDSLKDIWESKEWETIRYNFLKGDYLYECENYCPADPFYYSKIILKEYRDARAYMEKTVLPSPVAGGIEKLDNLLERAFHRRPLETLVGYMGYRISNPW